MNLERLKRARERYVAARGAVSATHDSKVDFLNSRGWTRRAKNGWKRGEKHHLDTDAIEVERSDDLTELLAAVDEVVKGEREQ